MTCRELIEFLMTYLDGALPADERARFDTHLGECPECVAYLRTYVETVKLAQGARVASDDPVGDDVPEELVRAIVAARRKA